MARLPPFGSLAPLGVGSTEGRTDRHGEVALRVPGDGLVLVRSVHLERCDDCDGADWRSWWAAYTFCVGSG